MNLAQLFDLYEAYLVLRASAQQPKEKNNGKFGTKDS